MTNATRDGSLTWPSAAVRAWFTRQHNGGARGPIQRTARRRLRSDPPESGRLPDRAQLPGTVQTAPVSAPDTSAAYLAIAPVV